MTHFTYNPAELTTEQLQAIESAKAHYKETIANLNKQEDQRMENYYNCVDDYSWGGLCTQANIQARHRAERDLNERIEEIVRDIASGEVAACGTREGQYGRYFHTYEAFGDKFISCAKKVSTYEKKGFRPYIQEVTEKVKRVGHWRNGDTRYEFIDYISITETLSTEICY